MAQRLSFGPDCSENHSDSLMQLIDKVVDVPVGQVQQIPRVLSVKTVEIPQLHSSISLDKVVDMPVVFNDKCPWVSVQKTAKVPQLHALFRWPMSLVCRFRCRRSSAVVNVPVISTATSFVSFDVEVPQIQFTGRVVDHSRLCNRDWYEAFMVAVMGPF